MGAWLLIALTTAASAAGPCDPIEPVERAESAFFSASFEEVPTWVAQTETSLGCSAVASPALLGRLWLVEGVTAETMGQDGSESFSAARRVGTAWNPDFGLSLQSRWDQAHPLPGAGRLLVTAMGDGFTVAVDGTVTDNPTDLPVGVHLVQAGFYPERMSFAQFITVTPGVTVTLSTGLTTPLGFDDKPNEPVAALELPPDPLTAPVDTTVKKRKKTPGWLIAGLTTGALAGAAAALAFNENQHITGADSSGSLMAAHQRQVGFGAAAYSLTGLALTGLVLEIAL